MATCGDNYCKEWFEQGKKLGQLWVLWKHFKERLEGNVTVQSVLDETEKELNCLVYSTKVESHVIFKSCKKWETSRG